MNPRVSPMISFGVVAASVCAGFALTAGAASASTASTEPTEPPAVLAARLVESFSVEGFQLDPTCVATVTSGVSADLIPGLIAGLDSIAMIPDLTIPEFTMPEITMPDLGDYGVDITMPEIPNITIPEISIPEISFVDVLSPEIVRSLVDCIVPAADVDTTLVDTALATVQVNNLVDVDCFSKVVSGMPIERVSELAEPIAMATYLFDPVLAVCLDASVVPTTAA